MMNRRHFWTSLVTSSMLSVALFGCGDPEVTGGTTGAGTNNGGGVEQTVTEEVFADAVQPVSALSFDTTMLREQLQQNEGVIELRPGFAFNAMRLYMDVQAFPGIEVAREGMDGRISKFEALAFQEGNDSEQGEMLRELFFPVPMSAIFVRFEAREEFEGVQGVDAVDYLDARFYADATPGEELPLHSDDMLENEDSFDDLDAFEQGYSMKEATFLTLVQGLHVPGAYVPPADVVARGDSASVRYEGSPSRPSGGLMPGARDLGEYLKNRFPGIRSYGGYSPRRKNVSGGSSDWSVHAAGRALDLMIPMSSPSVCGANNTVGDEVVRWLIYNAEYVGVSYLIWDRKSWGAYRNRGAKFRNYSGSNCTQKHADHIHLEILTEAGNRNRPFFGNMSGGDNVSGGGTPPPVSCSSATLGRRVDENACVQQDSSKGCNWFKCTGYNSYTSLTDSSSCGAQSTFAHQTCGRPPEPTPESDFDCPSATLGRRVSENACVQQSATRGCGWFQCTSPGSYTRLSDASGCSDEINANNTCAPTPTPGAARANQLVMTIEWTQRVDLDINVEEPSGQVISYSKSARSPNDGNLSLCDPTNSGRACYNDDVFKETIVWGELTDRVEPGTYTVSVRNFDEPNSGSYTIKAELFDAEGMASEVGNFSGTSTTYNSMAVGTVTVP